MIKLLETIDMQDNSVLRIEFIYSRQKPELANPLYEKTVGKSADSFQSHRLSYLHARNEMKDLGLVMGLER